MISARPPLTSGPRRGRLRLSLRGLMLAVIPLAAGLGWMAHAIRTQREAIRIIRAAGGVVRFDYQMQQVAGPGGTQSVFRTEPAAPRWLRWFLGDELFRSVQWVGLSPLPTPDTLAAVARLDRLEQLSLNDQGGGSDYSQLRGLSRLEDLQVGGSGVDDAALAAIAGIGTLRKLQVIGTAGTDAGFSRLAALPRLAELGIGSNPNLTADGLARALAGLPGLRTLTLADCVESPPAAAAVVTALARHHPELQSLSLAVGEVSDDDLRAIGRLTRLRELSLQINQVTDAGVTHLGTLRALETLNLAHNAVTDRGLATLGTLPRLEYLDLSGTAITDAGLPQLARVPHFRSLRLDGTGVTDAGLPALARFARLAQLGLSGNSAITDAGLPLLRSIRGLELVELSWTGVSDPGVAALKAAQPRLNVSRFHGSNPTAPSSPSVPR